MIFPSNVGGESIEAWKSPHLRRPVALALRNQRLFSANHAGGSLSIVDLDRRVVIVERAVGKRLEDVAVVPHSDWILAVDSVADELILMHDDTAELIERLAVRGSPVSVRVASDGAFCSIAALWARRIHLVDLLSDNESASTGKVLRHRATIDLPFAPRLQWISRDGTNLVVADSFRGRIAVIDTATGCIVSLRVFDGHNIRGMSADAQERELLVTHQILNEATPTTHDRVFWGTLMGNVVRSIPLDDLLGPTQSADANAPRGVDLSRWSLHPLGRPGAATGDPSAIATTYDGKAVAALSGVGEVAIRSAPLQPFLQRKVGQGPAAVVIDDTATLAYIANRFDDSISVLDLAKGDVTATISLGPQTELNEVERGEIMFHDARFALDGWYSCHSCHTDGHSNGLLNDNLSDDAFGASKRVLSLLGVGETGPWAWNGEQDSLHNQTQKSITITMRDHAAMHATPENITALVAYMQSLSPPPGILTARGEVDPQQRDHGQRVFSATGCVDCHQPPTFTSPHVYDVGLEDSVGRRKFNPPSLRGVSQRERLFHDNRAASLEDVLVKFGHGGADALSTEDQQALLFYLRSI
jgi:YVTN family beta-propeller protein